MEEQKQARRGGPRDEQKYGSRNRKRQEQAEIVVRARTAHSLAFFHR